LPFVFRLKAVVDSLRAQILFIQVWDYDAGFPGVQNDDYLGRATVDIFSVAKAGKKDMWVALEDVKTGMVHLELSWFNLVDDPNALKMHLAETQSLGLSTAMLIVFIDSAKLLPNARTTSKPDPYVMANVGMRSEQTSVRMRTSDPVWAQTLTFLVCSPDSDDLVLKVMDQKTGCELGSKKITLVSLLGQRNMELSHPLSLKNSGPETKLLVTIRLRMMLPGTSLPPPQPAPEVVPTKPISIHAEDEPNSALRSNPDPTTVTETRNENGGGADVPISSSVSDVRGSSGTIDETASLDQAASLSSEISVGKSELERESSVRRRNITGLPPGVVSQIQLTLRFSSQRQKLIIVVHKAKQLPFADNPDLPDPYVKLYLLPDRAANSKRKTDVVKDSTNPVFDETFEYTVAPVDLSSRELEVSIINRKGLFARSPLMGQCQIDLGQYDLSTAVTRWFDLHTAE